MEDTKETVIVTGSSGFVGQTLVERLVPCLASWWYR
jgi:nucleoside-diphosphate-sugar epimerase